jgi:Tol biopolymer transport system component
MRRAIAVAGLVLAGMGVAAVVAYRPPPADVGVLVIDTATGARRRVTTENGAVTWSRDGRRLFISGEVRIANPPWQPFDTRDLSGRRIARRKLVTAGFDAGVALSPDRRRIAYETAPRDRSVVNTGDLVVAPLGGGRATRLLTRARGTPAWSPDGTRLAVERWSRAGARGDGDDAARIVVVNAHGGHVRVLGRGGRPRWLPDGRLLVRRGTRLITTDRAGGDRRALVGTTGPVNDVAWSPDGASLAAVQGERVLLLDPAGNAPPREVTRIRGRALGGLAWSPDGRHLALTAGIPHHDD